MDSAWRELYGWLGEQIGLQSLGVADIFQSPIARHEYNASIRALQDTRMRMRAVDPDLPYDDCDDIATGIR